MTRADGERSAPLEALCGPGWERERDVLVLVGETEPALYEALRAAGQRRVVAFGGSPPPEPFARAETPLDLFNAVLAFPGDPPSRATFRRQPGAVLGDALLADLTRALRSAVESHATFQRTIDRHGPLWVRHGLANLAHLAEVPSIAALRGAFARVPCLIVSPGPSLVNNVGELARVQKRALVMTCSRALASLRDAGVAPDLVVASDPLFPAEHYAGCDPSLPSAFALDVAVHPDHFALPARRFFAFASHMVMDEWLFGALGESARLDTGGSVACSELSLALALGCDPIAFVGQDLALSDGRYYAATSAGGGARSEPALAQPASNSGAAEPELVQRGGDGRMSVHAWSGGTVPTTAALSIFLRWFEIAARSARACLYNCTEGGARIDGMEHVPLRDFLDKHLSPVALDVGAVLDRAGSASAPEQRRHRLREAVGAMRAQVELALREAAACRRLAERVWNGSESLEELSLAERRLAGALQPLPFLSMLAQERIRAARERGGRAGDLRESMAASAELFAVVEEAGRSARGPLLETLGRLGPR